MQCSRKSFKECQLAPLTPVSDLVGLIDLIELELGVSTGGQSVRNCLSEVVSEVRRSVGVASQESVSVLLEVIERLGV